MSIKDMVGLQCGHLTVISMDIESRNDPHGIRWLCQCDCGKQAIIRGNHLRNGRSLTCGDRYLHPRYKTHGQSSPRSGAYYSWTTMIDRCTNPNCPSYKHYGGRGIVVCERWLHSFETFLSDMGDRPQRHSLERIDNDGNYELGNCVWATQKRQMRNTRKNVLIAYGGSTKCLTDWAEIVQLHPSTISYRLKRGMSIEQALNTPSRRLS